MLMLNSRLARVPLGAWALLVLAAGAFLVAGPTAAQSVSAPTNRADLTVKLQGIVDDYLATHKETEGLTAISASASLPGGKGPNINVTAGRVSRADGAAPVTPESLFDIGSITKSMTAVVVLQLVKEGVLTLDAPIGQWLPEYPAWRDVTLRRLLSMISGIPSYDNTAGFNESFAKWGLGRHFSKEQLVSFVDPEIPNAPAPTTGFDYSNTNYILAQMIVQRTTGQSFAEHVTRRLLTGGLGLDDTFYSAAIYPDSVMSRLVSGYITHVEGSQAPLKSFIGQDLKFQDLSWAQAAGGVVGTPENVTLWARLLFQGPVLGAAERAELTKLVSMKTGEPIADVSADDPRAFGLGVARARLPSGEIGWFYEGETMGNRMIYGYFPDKDVVVAVGLNSAAYPEDGIAKALEAIYETVTSDDIELTQEQVQPND